MDQLKTNIESVNINLTNEVIDEINEIQKIYSNPCPWLKIFYSVIFDIFI